MKISWFAYIILFVLGVSIASCTGTNSTDNTSLSGSFLSGKQAHYTFRYDTTLWKKLDVNSLPDSEYELMDTAQEVYMVIIAQEGEMESEILAALALSKLQDAMDSSQILVSEVVSLHGEPMLDIRLLGSESGTPYYYHGYFYTGKAGTVQCIAWANGLNYPRLDNHITELLSGLHIDKM